MSATTHTCPGFAVDAAQHPEIAQAIDGGGFWLGCEHPARPVDEFKVTISGCPGCAIAHEAAKRRGMWRGTEDTVDGVLGQLGIDPLVYPEDEK